MHFIKYLQWLNGKGIIWSWKLQFVKTKHHRALYHVRSTKLFESFLYSNVFVCYEHLLPSGQKWHLFKYLKVAQNSSWMASIAPPVASHYKDVAVRQLLMTNYLLTKPWQLAKGL